MSTLILRLFVGGSSLLAGLALGYVACRLFAETILPWLGQPGIDQVTLKVAGMPFTFSGYFLFGLLVALAILALALAACGLWILKPRARPCG